MLSGVHRPIITRVILIALSVNIALIISYIGLWIMAMEQGLGWRADFTAFYTGGAILRDGLSSELYDLDLQAQYQLDLLSGQSFNQGVLPYNYPPHFAYLIAPLTYLSLPQAYLIWTLLQVVCLIGVIYLLLRLTNNWSLIERWLATTACLALPGFLRSFLLGSLSTLMLLSIFGWYWAHKQRKDMVAGIWLLVGSLKPQAIICPTLVSLVGKRWQTIAIGLLGGILIGASIVKVSGLNLFTGFFQRLIASSGYFDEYGINPASMYNLKGSLTLWLGSQRTEIINQLSWIGFILSLIITVWLWRGKWNEQSPLFTLRVAFTILLNIFFGLHVNSQDGLLLAAPALLIYDYLRQVGLPRTTYAIFSLICPVLIFFDEFFLRAHLPFHLAIFASLIMLIWAGYYLYFESKQPTQV